MSDQTQSLKPATPVKPEEQTKLSLPMIAERLAQMQIIFTESQKQLQEYIEEIHGVLTERLTDQEQRIAQLEQKLAQYEDLDKRLQRVERTAADVMLAGRR